LCSLKDSVKKTGASSVYLGDHAIIAVLQNSLNGSQLDEPLSCSTPKLGPRVIDKKDGLDDALDQIIDLTKKKNEKVIFYIMTLKKEITLIFLKKFLDVLLFAFLCK
jgi:hypothetical protein